MRERVLERRLLARGSRRTRTYRCDRRSCFGAFRAAGGTRRILSGLLHGRRYLAVQVRPAHVEMFMQRVLLQVVFTRRRGN